MTSDALPAVRVPVAQFGVSALRSVIPWACVSGSMMTATFVPERTAIVVTPFAVSVALMAESAVLALLVVEYVQSTRSRYHGTGQTYATGTVNEGTPRSTVPPETSETDDRFMSAPEVPTVPSIFAVPPLVLSRK
jgi:uncharacterized membrane protein YdbT with pleckstrin-like domain